MNYYLDTNICIAYLNGRSENVRDKLLAKKPSAIKIPSMVAAELYLGAYKGTKTEKGLQDAERFLSIFEIIPFDDRCILHYAKTRAALERTRQMIGPNDIIIAATVMAHGGILVTNNVREFARVDGLMCEDWI
jgi:tRNA(fMet)-specific endonuclease VapC